MTTTEIVAFSLRTLGVAIAAAVVSVTLIPSASAAVPTRALEFSATLDGRSRLPQPCPGGAYLCAEASIDRIGPAEYRLFRLTGEPSGDGCVLATVVTTFTVRDGSRLVLAEERTVCGPGQSLGAGGAYEYGNPTHVAGTWTVQEATGQFSGLGGSGTSTAFLAGARVTGSYDGTLRPTDAPFNTEETQ